MDAGLDIPKKIHFDNLDGIRFFCFLSVFFYHSFHTNSVEVKQNWLYQLIKIDVFGNGNLGVNFFFVLSGFLITYLLIQEKTYYSNISIKNFYMRRVLRIWPLYYFCVFFGFIIFPNIKLLFNQIPNETANFWYYLFFANNFDVIVNGQPDSSVLAVLWSLAIEEQFYLVWPLIIYIVPLKKMWIPFSILLLLSVIFRFNNTNEIDAEIHTLACMADLTVGAFGAWMINQFNFIKKYFQNLGKIYIGIIYLVVLMIFLFRQEIFNQFFFIYILDRIIIALFFLFIILEQNYATNSFFKLSKFKVITKLGKISYGLYCLHFIGILITINLLNKIFKVDSLWKVFLLDTFVALVLSIFISSISYKFYEKPFLKLKKNFER